MKYFPNIIQHYLVEKTTHLIARQYRTLCTLYEDPLEEQGSIFQSLVIHRYLQRKDKSKQSALLPQCPYLLDLRELIIEILDKEHGFNRLSLKRQVALENEICTTLNCFSIAC